MPNARIDRIGSKLVRRFRSPLTEARDRAYKIHLTLGPRASWRNARKRRLAVCRSDGTCDQQGDYRKELLADETAWAFERTPLLNLRKVRVVAPCLRNREQPPMPGGGKLATRRQTNSENMYFIGPTLRAVRPMGHSL
jgi:hypothetical protein